MQRKPDPTDFDVIVPDVGRFVFAHRKMRDEIAIQVAYARMIDGAPATQWLEAVCGMIAAVKTLTVLAPDGWNIDDLDPLDAASYAKLSAVFDALSEKERSFRANKEPKS